MNREECNQLLLDRGFFRKENKEETIPDDVIDTLYYKRADEL